MKHQLTSPPDAMGALFFLPGQYLFKRIENGRESAKALSSASVSRAFREFKTDTGWLARRILRCREEPEGSYLLAYEPPAMRTIFLEIEGGKGEEIRLALPSLILFGHAREFYLWAAKGRQVTAQTQLAIAPLPNIGGSMSGKICFGRNEVPEARIETIDEVWNLIFNTPFNGDQAAQKCRSESADVRKLLLNLANRQVKRFPATELILSTTTIEDVWEHCAPEKKIHSNF